MCTKCTGVNYISQPHSSYWVDRLKEIIPDQATRHYVHKIMGAALQGTVREHEIYFFIGKGRNGKGIIVETVAAALLWMYSWLADMQVDRIHRRLMSLACAEYVSRVQMNLRWGAL